MSALKAAWMTLLSIGSLLAIFVGYPALFFWAFNEHGWRGFAVVAAAPFVIWFVVSTFLEHKRDIERRQG